MKEQLIEQLKQLEKDLVIYNAAAQNPETSDLHKGPISFKVLTEMIKYNTLLDLVPEFTSSTSPEIMVAKSLAENTKLLSIQDGKVVVSSQFEELIKLQNQYKNGKIS
jgi:hypothetical protein